MRIAVVQGTRPEIIKNYSVTKALSSAGVPFDVLHTNQHSAHRMCADVYRDMGYEPSRRMPGKYRIGSAINWLQAVFERDRVTHVIVNGDTAASLAGALAAMYLGIEVTHIEAGLRSHDPHMLEERNRIMVDSISTLLFAYTDHESALLKRSPDARGTVFVEGNTTVDVLHDFGAQIGAARPRHSKYVFVTMHRKEFTDSADRMHLVFRELGQIASTLCPVIFPMHPRTADAMQRHGIDPCILGAVEVVEPISIFESLALQKSASAVVTDSGCIQEEAYMLRVPCVTVRDNTERHQTVLNGANVVTGFNEARIRSAIRRAVDPPQCTWPDVYGEPGVGARIVKRILGHVGMSPFSGPKSSIARDQYRRTGALVDISA